MTKGYGKYCAAVNCHNCKGKNKEKSFFSFPRDTERSKRWVINCRRKDLLSRDSVYLYKNCCICSDHFESHFFLNDLRNRLQPNAIPTIFNVPNPPKLSATKRQKDVPTKRRSLKKNAVPSQNIPINVDESLVQRRVKMLKKKSKTGKKRSFKRTKEFLDDISAVQTLIDLSTAMRCPEFSEEITPAIDKELQKQTEVFQLVSQILPLSLTVRYSSLSGVFYGIWSQENIPEGTRFGPFEEYSRSYDVQGKELKTCTVDGESSLNWLQYINSTSDQWKQNIILYECQEQIFCISTKQITAETELLIWFQDNYETV